MSKTTSEENSAVRYVEQEWVLNGRAYRLTALSDGSWACTSDRPVNPKTGRGWQSGKNMKNFPTSQYADPVAAARDHLKALGVAL